MKHPHSWLLATLATSLVGLAGCEKDNPGYCGDQCPIDADIIDGASGCIANPGLCTGELVCDHSDDTCVDCRMPNSHQNADCTEPTAPVCGANRDCRACAADSECDSNFCEGGRCIAATDVVYLAANATDNADCSKDLPCKSPVTGMSKITATRKYLRFEPSATVYSAMPDATVTINKDVIIHGKGAILERPGGNQIVDISAGNVIVDGLTIRDAAGGGNADGIKCAGASLTLRGATVSGNNDRGIEIADCVLDIDRSVVADNNQGGIRFVDGRLTIRNSYFFDNRGNGALTLSPNATPNLIESNTIVKNTGGAGALACNGATAITARNNIVYGTVGPSEVSGTACTYSYSVIGALNPPAGTMVRSMTPAELALENVVGNTVADFHIDTTANPASLLRGGGDPTTPASIDYDGDARPTPAGPPDIGADEVP